jgi:hypothetical protein
VLNAYATWSTTDPTGSGGAGTLFDGIIDPGGYYQDGSITQLVSGITNEPTRSPRKLFQYNTLSSSPFAPAGLTRAFGGQGLLEKACAASKITGRSIRALFWWLRYSAFSYSRDAKASIALHSSMRTQDLCVIFGIDSSDHQSDVGPNGRWHPRNLQHGSCLDLQRTGHRNSSRVFDRRWDLGRPEDFGISHDRCKPGSPPTDSHARRWRWG